MATNKNFEVKNGLTIAGTERISSAGAFSGSLASATTATTQSATDNSTKIATTAYTDAAITALVDSSPGTLNTLNELAAALNDDAAFSTTVTNSIATKAPLASPSFTGNADVAGELYVGTQNSVFAENVLRFNSAGASYIDHTTTGQSIRFRVSNSSALDTTPLILHSNGNAVFAGGIEAGNAGISTQDHRMPAGAGYITYSPANGGSDTLTIRKHGVTQQFFNASGVYFPQGSVGIGTTGPNGELEVNKTTAGGLGGRIVIRNASSNSGSYCRLYLSATANDPEERGTVIQGENVDGNNNMAMVFKVSAGASPAERMRITTTGADVLGTLSCDNTFNISDGSTNAFLQTGSSLFQLGSSSNAPVIFYSNNDEKMRILSSGELLIGKNSGATATPGLEISKIHGVRVTVDQNVCSLFNRTTSAGDIALWRLDGTTRGAVYVSSAGTQYATISDLRLKNEIQSIDSPTNKLMAMNPVSHKWKADPEADAVHGFIAQEMAEIVPEAVSGDPEGEEMMSMDYGRITPVIVAALQEALEEIQELKNKINKLETK